MIVDTRNLFLRLLRTFEIATVCDVGSMNGADALRFRRALPGAVILALEPNPQNFVAMHRDEALRRANIRVLPYAACDRDGRAPLFVVAANGIPVRKGLSSLHRRSDATSPLLEASVRTVRLDRLLRAERVPARAIALWIDVEGVAFEVLRGAEGILADTRILHVEVETAPCIAAAQKLLTDVDAALAAAGFRLLATDQPRAALQLNALFIRDDLIRTRSAEIRRHARAARLRHDVKHALRAVLPHRLRHVLVPGCVETRLR